MVKIRLVFHLKYEVHWAGMEGNNRYCTNYFVEKETKFRKDPARDESNGLSDVASIMRFVLRVSCQVHKVLKK
jgi:hypothetical protein